MIIIIITRALSLMLGARCTAALCCASRRFDGSTARTLADVDATRRRSDGSGCRCRPGSSWAVWHEYSVGEHLPRIQRRQQGLSVGPRTSTAGRRQRGVCVSPGLGPTRPAVYRRRGLFCLAPLLSLFFKQIFISI